MRTALWVLLICILVASAMSAGAAEQWVIAENGKPRAEIVIPKEKTTIKSESGTTSYEVKRWVCTVLDPAAVPKEYCEPVKKLLDDAVKMGAREIPGCKIEEITETRFRT